MKKIDLYKIIPEPFRLIGEGWMLITAGNLLSFNTMTASWGGFGILWNVPVAFCFIRPTRYTWGFANKFPDFTLSFFEEKYRSILEFCGSHSGLQVNKIKETGLIPFETDMGNISFEQAGIVLECRKLYFDDFKPDQFQDKKIHNAYPKKDYHRMFVGEIVNSYTSD